MRATQYLAGFLLGVSELTPIYGNETRYIEDPIRSALDYLSNHITENIRLESLAAAAGYSLSRFKYKFKETIGITPAEYVTMQKIELAKRRLAEGDESITELAYNLGYSSSNYFCSVFKKMMNCSPQNYRLRYRKKKRKMIETTLFHSGIRVVLSAQFMAYPASPAVPPWQASLR